MLQFSKKKSDLRRNLIDLRLSVQSNKHNSTKAADNASSV